jgi:ABC-type antimicrobial peptide transport system permease subunit
MVGVLFRSAVVTYVAEDRGFQVTDVSFGRVTVDEAEAQGSITMAAILENPTLAATGMAVGSPPLSGQVIGFPRVVRGPNDPEPSTARTWVAPVSSAYPSSLGIQLLEGRFFSPQEAARGDPVAVVDSVTARVLSEEVSLVGQAIEVWIGERQVTAQVIGTVAPVELTDARTRQRVQQVYVPFALATSREYPVLLNTRVARSAAALIERAAPSASLSALSSFEDLYRAEARTQLIASTALAWVAGLGLVLALVGLFAVLGHVVERRRREFGVRQAVGGTPSGMVWLAVKSGMTISGVGVLAGLASAVVAGNLLRSALLGVAPWDGRSAALTAALVLLSALVACARPAILAGRCDPSELMRSE